MRKHLLDTMVHMAFYRGCVPAKWALLWRGIREGRRSLVLVEGVVAEMFERMSRERGEEAAWRRILWLKGLRGSRVLHADDNLAMAAGRLRSRHGSRFDLSLVDCFVLAAASREGCEVVTTEVGLRDCARELGVGVSWLPVYALGS